MKKTRSYTIEICKPLLVIGAIIILFALFGCSPKPPETIVEDQMQEEVSGPLPALEQNQPISQANAGYQVPDYSFEPSPSDKSTQETEKNLSQQERDELFPVED